MSAIVYLLQVSGCMAIFYLFYYLMLNRLTFFTINRYYLLVTLALSFVVPLLTIPTTHYEAVVQPTTYIRTFVTHAPIAQTTAVIADKPTIDWMLILEKAYIVIAIGLFIQLVITLINFFSKLKGKKIKSVGNIHILHGSKALTNGSFLNYIFLNDDELSPAEIQQIIAHEMLHVKLLHSVDRIIVKIVQIVLWFNPIAYLYARSMEENHEFEVDREIARSTDKNEYADLLLHLSVAANGLIYNNFSKVPLKKRIIMLFNKPSANVKRVVYLLVAPVVVLSCLAFARLKNNENKPAYKHPFSVIKGVDKLGKSPLVFIDDKPYPSNILYSISDRSIKTVMVFGKGKGIKGYGVTSKDGIVKITTKYDSVINMTVTERQNLVKEAEIPASRFFSRITLRNENGQPFEKIIIHQSTSGSMTEEVAYGARVAYFINKKRYTEAEIKNLSPAVIATLTGDSGTMPSKDWPGTEGCESVIYFTTRDFGKIKATDEKNIGPSTEVSKHPNFLFSESAINQYNVNDGSKSDDTITRVSAINGVEYFGPNPLVLIDGKNYSRDVLYKISKHCIKDQNILNTTYAVKKYGLKASDGCIEIKTKNGLLTYMSAIERGNLTKEASVPKTQYYTRLILKKEDGSLYDEVVIKTKNGGYALTQVDHNAKVAFFIDQTFYDEEAIKKLPATTVASFLGRVGVSDVIPNDYPGINMHGYKAMFFYQIKGVPIAMENFKYPWGEHIPEIEKDLRK